MIDSVKACILTAYAPGTVRGTKVPISPYGKGQKRLLRSLIHHGFRHDIVALEDWPEGHTFDESSGYNIKAAAFEYAINEGYTRILWLDSSVWAIKNIEPVFDYIEEKGWYFHTNGFNCANTCDDAALRYFKLRRDEAERMPDCSTSMFGVRTENPKARKFLEMWLQTARDGLWQTSREHNNGSRDERFFFDRQDQSCASVIINMIGIDMLQRNHFSAIAKDHDYSVPTEQVNYMIEMINQSSASPEEKEKMIRKIKEWEGYPKSVVLVMRGL